MIEFLTWNTQNAPITHREWGFYLILPLLVALMALNVTILLDKYGAPDDSVTYDPRYDITVV